MTASFTFTADSGTDVLTTSSAHGKATGDGPVCVRNVGGALPSGLAALTDYWLIVTGASTVKLATSSANALLGTAINLTTNGTGTNYLEIGIPYRRPRTYAAGSQLKSADLNDNFDAWKALYALLTGQSQGIWSGVSLAALDLTGTLKQTGAITPSALASGNTDDWAPSGLSTASVIRATPDAANSTLRGLTDGSAGRTITLVNIGTSGNLILTHDDGTASTAANRFLLANNASATIRPNGGAILWYDGTSARWRLVSASL